LTDVFIKSFEDIVGIRHAKSTANYILLTLIRDPDLPAPDCEIAKPVKQHFCGTLRSQGLVSEIESHRALPTPP
jgi:hypothetical protein